MSSVETEKIYYSLRTPGKHPYSSIQLNGRPLDREYFHDQYYYVRNIDSPTPIIGAQFRKHILNSDIAAAIGILTPNKQVVWTFDAGEHFWFKNEDEQGCVDFCFFNQPPNGVAISIMNPSNDISYLRPLVNFVKNSGIPARTRLLIIQAISEAELGQIQYDNSIASFLDQIS